MRKLAVLAVLMICAACVHAAVPAAKPIDYMRALRQAEGGLTAALKQAPAPHDPMAAPPSNAALQELGIERSRVGDERGAIAAFDAARGLRPDDAAWRQPGEVDARLILGQFVAEDAIDVIVRRARDRQIVILNEAHHVARHRSFALALARELRKIGFEYLAMETLTPDTAALSRRGYAVGDSGAYTREPFFGDYVRQALSLGYVPVAYEIDGDVAAKQSSADILAQIDAREEAQAQNLVNRIFAKDPKARVLIHVGYQHVMKGEMDIAGRKLAWMAERLRRKTGIDPLCIDQANATQRDPATLRALENLLSDPRAAPEVVLRDRDRANEYWPGIDAVDLVVVHRAVADIDGRPGWIGLRGGRHAMRIPAKLLPRHGRRLIQAFLAGEDADAVPVDQVLVEAGETPAVLMLPDAKIRFAFQD